MKGHFYILKIKIAFCSNSLSIKQNVNNETLKFGFRLKYVWWKKLNLKNKLCHKNCN